MAKNTKKPSIPEATSFRSIVPEPVYSPEYQEIQRHTDLLRYLLVLLTLGL